MRITNSLFTPEHTSPSNLEEYILQLCELCAGQLTLEMESRRHREMLVSMIRAAFEK